MKASEIRDLSPDERREKLHELRAELFQLRTRLQMGALDNPMRMKAIRRDIARILTVEREAELQHAPNRTKGTR